jgi:cytochrome bd-type quinol oxidase subunit 1
VRAVRMLATFYHIYIYIYIYIMIMVVKLYLIVIMIIYIYIMLGLESDAGRLSLEDRLEQAAAYCAIAAAAANTAGWLVSGKRASLKERRE